MCQISISQLRQQTKQNGYLWAIVIKMSTYSNRILFLVAKTATVVQIFGCNDTRGLQRGQQQVCSALRLLQRVAFLSAFLSLFPRYTSLRLTARSNALEIGDLVPPWGSQSTQVSHLKAFTVSSSRAGINISYSWPFEPLYHLHFWWWKASLGVTLHFISAAAAASSSADTGSRAAAAADRSVWLLAVLECRHLISLWNKVDIFGSIWLKKTQ